MRGYLWLLDAASQLVDNLLATYISRKLSGIRVQLPQMATSYRTCYRDDLLRRLRF